MTRIRRSAAVGTLVSVCVISLAASLAPSVAYAQASPSGSGSSGSTSADAKPASDPKLDEARQRYQRGLQLFNEANYEAARVEFERAYQLAPSYKILYNIGLSYEQLGDYVQALTTLQRYLEQGGNEISPERRSEVAKELAQIRPRIGKVTVRTNVRAAELLVDDGCATEAATQNVQCGPLDGISRVVLMNPGRRRIMLRHDGYLPETQILTVAGSDQLDVVINLKALPKAEVINERNPFLVPAIVGWGVTAAVGVGAGVFGFLAVSAKDDQEAKLSTLGTSQDDLSSARSKTQTLATVSDVLLVSTGVAALASTYFTVRAVTWKKPGAERGPGAGSASATPSEVRIGFAPGGAMAVGTF